MKKIKIYLDYRCFPVWIYDDNEMLVKNDLPLELIGDKELDDVFVNIQNIYDGLFLDNSTEFNFIGFKSESDREEFLKMIEDAINLIKVKLDDTYIIENKIDI
ncbi:hypothetical protein [Amphibacillus jilinensis]|uniref:hypothetical protein n=1 Tax=Amphibacillus jilinensis TaxID=1216008 RepID=UPI0002F6FFF3|nr:hypothetical protein [Amphibacillus jilinensis]